MSPTGSCIEIYDGGKAFLQPSTPHGFPIGSRASHAFMASKLCLGCDEC